MPIYIDDPKQLWDATEYVIECARCKTVLSRRERQFDYVDVQKRCFMIVKDNETRPHGAATGG